MKNAKNLFQEFQIVKSFSIDYIFWTRFYFGNWSST